MNKSALRIFLAVILISSAPIFSQLGVTLKRVWIFSFYTIISGFISLSLFVIIKKKKIVFSKDFLIPILFYVLGITLFFYSFTFLSGVVIGFLGQTQIVFTLGLSYILLKEKVEIQKIIAAFLVIIGSFVFYFQESLNFNQFGVLTITFSMLFFSINNYFTKKLREKHDEYSITFYKNLICSIVLLILCVIFSKNELFTIDISVMFAFLQGFLSDFVGWTLFVSSLKHIELNKAFIIYSFSSVITLLYSFIVFGANFILLQLIGGILILIGNIFFNK
ncbi:DMT family transporter [Promethearchaeum syntrophicum]|uniref:DMT family transporter n=1 Tax=Promethearchaeum syntrophicum TaxID=2594042 RepID=A0A5B9DCZ3_9ARCH|nr:DMT family transporter [Candidatus Prometheoarchaeum syntrophicum]QEE16747.1 EamA-like transporter family protein [Candidatus Prometheoarchaeum syntrophicum]